MAGTISFSGLSSGLDTSSWVEALVSVKQTTITSLQSEQQVQRQLLSVINNIKSYFTSFQSCLQKITDSQFGISAIDLFAQNVALSSNSNIVTATATTEAARQSYDVFVDQLATSTKASSGYRRMETVNATLDTTLGQLGASNGTITINSKSFNITKDDTLKSLIQKFSDVGVLASFDEKKGKFTISSPVGELNDGTTNLKTALKLQDTSIMGFSSGSRVYATENTELHKLGLTAGQVQIEGVNHTIAQTGTNYTITKDGGTAVNINTIGDFLNYLKSGEVNAETAQIDSEGNILIKGAVIESVTGGSNIKDVLKLGDIIERTVMQSSILTWQENHYADENTTLKDLGITGDKTLSINGGTATNITDTTTLGSLKTTLAGSGIDMTINENGVISLDTNGATISGTILDALGLQADKAGSTLTSDIHTVTYKANGNTLLSDFGITSTMSYDVYNSDGTAKSGIGTQNNLDGLTINQFITKLQGHGLNAHFDTENQKIIIDDGYISGTAATQLGMTNETVVHQEYATSATTLESLGATGNKTLEIDGVAKTYTKETTLQTVISDITTAGGQVTFEDGMITISEVNLSGDLTTLLGLETTAKATSITSGALSVVTNNTSTSDSAVTATFNHDIALTSTLENITGTTDSYTLTVNGTTVNGITKDTTLQGVWDKIKAVDAGVTFTINDDNTISISGVTMTGTLVSALGFESTGKGTSMNSDGIINVGGIETIANGSTTLEQLGITDTKSLIINGTTKNYAKTTTLDTILNDITTIGGDASIDANGVITVTETTLDGDLVNLLGLSPTYQATSATSNPIQIVTQRTGTSSAALTPSVTTPITGSTTLAQITGDAAGTTYSLSINGGTSQNHTTLSSVKTAIEAAGGTMNIDNNGKITIENVALSGSAVAAMQLTPTEQKTTMTSTNAIKLNQSFLLNGTTTFEDLGVANTDDARSYAIYDTFGNIIQVTGTNGTKNDPSVKTIDTWITEINNAMNTHYGTTGTTYAKIEDGVISINKGYVAGNLVNNIGMKTESIISGKQIAGSTALYQEDSEFIGVVSNQIIPITGAKQVSAQSDFTAGETYYISTAADLTKLAELVTAGKSTDDVTFVMTNDIDVSSIAEFSIGTSSNNFKGNFYGNGYEISGLKKYLFDYTNTATIRDLGLTNVNITTNYAAALISSASNTTIENTYVSSGTISAQGEGVNGGLVADMSGGSINNSYSSVNISGEGQILGGLVGRVANATISNSYATGNVTHSETASASNFAGGLIGSANGSEITNSYASGNVSITFDNTKIGKAGGFIGNSNNTNISNSYANGNVTANGHVDSRAGAFYGTTPTGGTFSNVVYCTDATIGGTQTTQDLANGWSSAQLYASGNGMPNLAGKNPFINREIQSNTTLAKIGLATESERSITVNIDGETFTNTFAANATVQDVINYLNGITGVQATFDESQLRIKAQTSQNLVVGGTIATALFGGTMSETSVYATQVTDDKLYYTRNNINISNATRIADLTGNELGGTINALINDTTQVSLSYSADDTISDVISDLAAYGINANVSADGKFSFTSNDKVAIFGDIGRALTGPDGVTTYTESGYESNNIEITTNPALATTTTLDNLGINSGTIQILDGNGNYINSIDIDNSKSLAELGTILSSYGFTLAVDATNQKVSITSNSNQTISDGSSNLLSALKISSWAETKTNMTTTTTMAQLGHTNGTTLTVTLDGSSTMNLTFGANNNIQDVINSLSALGINASVTDGKFEANSTTHTFRFSGDLSKLLDTYTESNKGYKSTSHSYNTSTEKLTTGSTIEELFGENKNGTLNITLGDGEIVSLNYNADDTVQNIIDDLANLGITASVDGTGKFSAISDDKTFRFSGDIGRKLQGGNNPTYTDFDDKYSSKDLAYQTTGNITNDTTLAQIGVKSGQIYVYDEKDNIIDSINITDTMTVGEVDAALLAYGFQMSLDAGTSKITITSNDGYSLSDGSSDMISKFKLNTWTKTENELAGTTTLSQMGFKNGADLNLLLDGTTPTTITFGATDTVNTIISALGGLGITASIDAATGAFTTTSNTHSFVFSGDLGTFLTKGGTYTNTDKAYATKDALEYDVPVVTNTSEKLTYSHALNTNDTVESMGFADGGVVRVILDGNTSYSFSFLGTDTMQDIMDTLATHGIQTTIDADGKISLRNDDHSFTLGGALGSYITNGGTYTNKSTGYTSQSQTFETTEHIDLNTKLSALGVASGSLNIVQDGTIVADNIQIDEDTTVGQLFNAIKVYDMQGAILVDASGNTSIQIYAQGDNKLTDGTCDAVSKLGFIDVLQGDYRSHIEYWDTEATSGLLTEDTLLTSLNKDGKTSVGSLIFELGTGADATQHIVNISATDTIGSLIEKLEAEGVHAELDDGILKIDNSIDSITITGGTSQIIDTMGLTNGTVNTYAISNAALTYEDEVISSVANFADGSTKLSTVNVTSGQMSIYVDGKKATVNINPTATDDWTFEDLFDAIKNVVRNDCGIEIDIGFLTKDGNIVKTPTTAENTGIIAIDAGGNHKIVIGASNDKSNFATIANLQQDTDSRVAGTRALYKVNVNSKITEAGLFKAGDITEGDFVIGDAVFTIDANTTFSSLINQINKSDKSYASAYWDTLSGTLVIQSTLTGESLINIESGAPGSASNFTNIMGFTKVDGGNESLITEAQTLGHNAQVRINGTLVTSTSNTITSDISKIKGLTLNIKDLSKGQSTTITVEQDDEGIYNAVNDIIDSYNTLMQGLEKELGGDGPFSHDTMFKTMYNNLKRIVTQSIGGTDIYKNLAAIGISTGEAQDSISTDVTSLIIDKDKFMNCLEENSDGVKQLLVGTTANNGVFLKINGIVDNTLKTTGYLSSTEKSINKTIDKMGDKITDLTVALARYREQLQTKFSAMERTISDMQTAYVGFLG